MIRKDRGIPGGCTRGPSPPWAFCGGCYANLRRRANYRHCLSYVRPTSKKPYVDFSAMKRPTSAASSEPGDWSCPDPNFAKNYPALAQGMCDPYWDEGKPRVPWSLRITFDSAGVGLCLNDKSAKLYAFTNAPDLATGLRMVEEAAQNETLAWRKSKF